VQGGDIDRLEELLDRDRRQSRDERVRQDAHGELDRLLEGGRRREALARAEALVAASPEDAMALDRLKTIRARRTTGPCVTIDLRGVRVQLVLGDEVVVGRDGTSAAEPRRGRHQEGAITVPSHAISRRHLAIARTADAICARDLGSRNGTELRGMRIAGPIPVAMNDGLELKLGGEVPLRLSAATDLAGALTIEVGGMRYVAPLGPARLGIGAWRLEVSDDGWLELVTDEDPPAYLGQTRLDARIALLSGDAISAERGEASVLRIA
jgi:hypothetical protein